MMNTDKRRTLQGQFYEAASGHKTYEIFYAAPNILFEIGNILVAKFGCTALDLPGIGVKAAITKCQKDDILLDLGWDHWSGFYILAHSAEGDKLIEEIGNYLNSMIGGKDFEKFIHDW
jgi:hypothetical protein